MPLRRSYSPDIRPDTDVGNNPAWNLLMRRLQREEQTPSGVSQIASTLGNVAENFLKMRAGQKAAREYGNEKEGYADLMALQNVINPYARTEMKTEQNLQDQLARVYPYGGSEMTEEGLKPVPGKTYAREPYNKTDQLPNPYFERGIGPEMVNLDQYHELRAIMQEQGKDKRTLSRKTGGTTTPVVPGGDKRSKAIQAAADRIVEGVKEKGRAQGLDELATFAAAEDSVRAILPQMVKGITTEEINAAVTLSRKAGASPPGALSASEGERRRMEGLDKGVIAIVQGGKGMKRSDVLDAVDAKLKAEGEDPESYMNALLARRPDLKAYIISTTKE